MDNRFHCGPRPGAVLALLLSALASASIAAPFPVRLSASGPAKAHRPWTMADIVEVTRITSTAIDGEGRLAAFVLKQPVLADDRDHYALYVAHLPHGGGKKLLEAAFLGDLQWRPGSKDWSVRADFGQGVQLYAFDRSGRRRVLRARLATVPMGGADGIPSSASEARRDTGIGAYGWNTDGSAFWYLCVTPAPAGAPPGAAERGVVYNPETSMAASFYSPVQAKAIELHVVRMSDRRDTRVDAWPGGRIIAERAFQPGRVRWLTADRLAYRMPYLSADGLSERTASFDRRTGRSDRMGPGDAALPQAPIRGGALTLRRGPTGQWRLLRTAQTGDVEADLGEVPFSAIGGAYGAWSGPGGRSLFGVLDAERFGLVAYPRTSAGAALEALSSSLSHCAFDPGLTVGVCSLETLTQAPRLVGVSPRSGQVWPIANPNLRYDTIAPLTTRPFTWTNALGNSGQGYVTYPRDYHVGGRYPAIVITHAADARNQFVFDGFQWAFPLQVFAEHGYLVLSVNEHVADIAVLQAMGGSGGAVDVGRVQKAMGLDAVATMNAAVEMFVSKGDIDPNAVGIAGFSRGGIVTTLALSQPGRFRAGISADTGLYNTGSYWRGADLKRSYKTLFGGSPLDPRYTDSYRALSPSLRADRFNGPLLQLFTGDVAPAALELDSALRDAHIPTQLVAYVGETHVFHQPSSILSAMVRSLDWFDLWLRGRKDQEATRARAAISGGRWPAGCRAREEPWTRCDPSFGKDRVWAG